MPLSIPQYYRYHSVAYFETHRSEATCEVGDIGTFVYHGLGQFLPPALPAHTSISIQHQARWVDCKLNVSAR
jgi:hypothetical protein